MGLNEINGIKKIKKFDNLSVFVSIPLNGVTRGLAFAYARAFKRVGANVIIFDSNEKFNYFMDILDEKIFEKNKTDYAKFLNDLISKDMMYELAIKRPDIFFGFSNSYFDANSLEVVKELGTKNIFYIIDSNLENDFIQKTEKFVSKYYSIFKGDFEYMVPGCDIMVFSPKPISKKFKVSFIGSATPYRVSVIRKLLENSIPINIWGEGWDDLYQNYKNLVVVHKDNLSDKNVATIFNSTFIVLNIPQTVLDYNVELSWLNTRLFEATGCGSCVLAYSNDSNVLNFVENEEIILYKNENDLITKIIKISEDISYINYIGQKASKKVRQLFSITLNTEKILSNATN